MSTKSDQQNLSGLVLFIILYMVITFESVDEILKTPPILEAEAVSQAELETQSESQESYQKKKKKKVIMEANTTEAESERRKQ